jgi:BirA family biotin operon repressor/biotin-[acetyl-CoA-carboxylase] ligase
LNEEGPEAYPGVTPGSVEDGREALGLRTRYVGHAVHYLSSVTSTSGVLRKLAGEGAAEGAVVLADEQTAGRGRSGRAWFSPAGLGVWASVLLRPSASADALAPLTIAAAVSVAKALSESTGAPLGVKWPNDIVAGVAEPHGGERGGGEAGGGPSPGAELEGRKLGGLLLESVQTAGGRVDSAVLGIGVNVGLTADDLPDELRDVATSLMMLLGQPVARVGVLRTVLESLEKCFDLFEQEGIGAFRERWQALSTTLGSEVHVRTGDRDVTGRVTDLSPEGALVIEGEDGARTEVWYGDVTLRRSGKR